MKENSKLKIYNGRIITPYRIIQNGTVLISDGIIIAVTHGNADFPDSIEIDAKEKFISPGFIDIHVHGGGGYDFIDNSENRFFKNC